MPSDSTSEVAEVQRGAGRRLQTLHELELLVRVLSDVMLHQAELDLQCHELLLRTVVQVALELPPLLVLRRDEALP
jgi:hypothetical protein